MPRWCRQTIGAWCVAWALGGCGAFGEAAPPLDQDLSCPSLEQTIPTVLRLLEEGELDGLRQVLEEGVSETLRGEIVELGLVIVRALPPGTLESLSAVVAYDKVWALLPLVGDVVRFVAEDGGGRWEVIAPAADLVVLCPGGELLPVAGDLLLDPVILDAVNLILSDAEGIEGLLAALDIDLNDPDARDAVLALLDNVLASFAAPGFRLNELEELLVGLADLGLVDLRMPAIRGLLALAHEALDDPARMDVLQRFVGCVRTVDPELVLVQLVYDLIAAEAVTLDDLAAVVALADPAQHGDALLQILADVLDFLGEDAQAREALADVLLALLQEDDARLALPDLAVLLETDAVPEVVDLLVGLVYGCHATEGTRP